MRAVADQSPLGRARAALVVVFFLAIYLCNGDFLTGNDAKSSVYLSAMLWKERRLLFTPAAEPFMFRWVTHDTGPPGLAGPKHYLTPTRYDGYFANTFGPGPAVLVSPLFAAQEMVVPDVRERPWLLWYSSKLAASLLVAFSALLLLLTLLRSLTRTEAGFLTLAYGLGTSIWSISSQALWQHGPNVFFLTLGLWLLLREGELEAKSLVCGGLALGAAAAMRPTSLVVVAVFFLVLLRRSGRQGLLFLAGSVLPLGLLAAHNVYCFGSPSLFGQTLASPMLALAKTGSLDLWQTPLWLGISGLLVSPGRGLLVHSPICAVGFLGLLSALRGRLGDLGFACAASFMGLLAVASKWYDWWGGWCFSYRPIVDTLPFLFILAAPVLRLCSDERWKRLTLGLIFCYSVSVQVLGAFAYHPREWNGKNGEDIDRAPYRYRLWSWAEMPLAHYASDFASVRARKQDDIRSWLDDPER